VLDQSVYSSTCYCASIPADRWRWYHMTGNLSTTFQIRAVSLVWRDGSLYKFL